MNEKKTNTEVTNSLKHFGFFAYKIADTMGTQFIVTKPCDILACSPHGVFVAVECKLMKKWGKVDRKILRENQIESLDAAVARNGIAYFILNIHIAANPQKGIKRESHLVVFDWSYRREQIVSGYFTKQKLIEESKCKAFGLWCESFTHEKKKLWNFKKLVYDCM